MTIEFDDLLDSGWRADRKELWVTEQRENRTKMFEWLEELLGMVGKDPTVFQQYLDIQARLIKYSARNTLLVMKQFPAAERLGDYSYWRDQGVYVRRQDKPKPILILEPGPEYTREDNTVGTYYNVKKVYDVSQTTAKGKMVSRENANDRQKLQALIQSAMVPVRAVEHVDGGRGAYYDSHNQEITVMRGMSAANIFQALSCELAHVELEEKGVTEGERTLVAYCASYVLCKRYGFDVASYEFHLIPTYFEEMDSRYIAEELGRIRDAAWEIAGRVDRNLEMQRVRTSNEPERQER